ncbi:hypothetical protein ACPA9J_31390 [Pseudomonas aeruginosa]
MLVWLAFIGIDLLILAGPPRCGAYWRCALACWSLLVCGCLIMLRRHIQLMVPLSIACVLALGVGAAAVVGLAHRADPGYPYEACCWSVSPPYFLAGLRLSQTRELCVGGAARLPGFQWWAGTQGRWATTCCSCCSGNLIGAVGCYLPGVQVARAFPRQPPVAGDGRPRQA